MDRIMVLTTVPNTAEMAKSSANVATTVTATATTTVTEAITKTIHGAARTSFYTATKQVKPSDPSTVPEHLMIRVMRLLELSGYSKPSLLYAAVQIALGGAVMYGLSYAWKRLPKQDVPRGEKPKKWKGKIRFAYNFLKNAASDNEDLRREIEEARQETELAKQNVLFAERLYSEKSAAKPVQSQQEKVPVADAEHTGQLHAQKKPLDAEPATAGPGSEDLLRQLEASDLARKHLAEQLKQLQESRDNVRDDLLSKVTRLESELEESQQSNDELRVDLDEAHEHANGLKSTLEDTETKLAEEKEYVAALKEFEREQQHLISDLLGDAQTLKESRDKAEELLKTQSESLRRAKQALEQETLSRQNADLTLFRRAENAMLESSPAGADLSTPAVFRFMERNAVIDTRPPPMPSSPHETPQAQKVSDSPASSEDSDGSSTSSKKRKRNVKLAKKVEATPNKRRAPSPEEASGSVASESDAVEMDPVQPTREKSLDFANVPSLARPDAASSTTIRAPAPPATPLVARRQSSRIPGMTLRNPSAINYSGANRRSALPQPQTVPETPAPGRRRAPSVTPAPQNRRAPSATPAPETARSARVTRSQSPAKR